VEATPEDHPGRGGWLSDLGNHLSRQYERTGNLQDLEAAIGLSEEAVEATPGDHPDRAVLLSSLGNGLSSRYRRTGNLQDLEAAIGLSEAAVDVTPEGHPDRAGRLNNLGSRLSNRYQQTRNLQDLEAAIATPKAGVETTPDDHPDRATYLQQLANHFNPQHKQTGNPQHLEAALAARVASSSIITAPILLRIQGALHSTRMLVYNPIVKNLSRACSLLCCALDLIPLATPRSLEREDQQHILGQLTGLASLATSVFLEVVESPLEALRMQELCRSATNGQLLDYRSDIPDLIEHHPMRGEDFDSLRQELDSPWSYLQSSDVNESTSMCPTSYNS